MLQTDGSSVAIFTVNRNSNIVQYSCIQTYHTVSSYQPEDYIDRWDRDFLIVFSLRQTNSLQEESKHLFYLPTSYSISIIQLFSGPSVDQPQSQQLTNIHKNNSTIMPNKTLEKQYHTKPFSIFIALRTNNFKCLLILLDQNESQKFICALIYRQ